MELKCASFMGNVEYVECFGESLGTPPSSSSPPQKSTYSTFPLKERHFSENVRLSAEMFEHVEFWGGLLNQNVLLSAEMLNMLNFFGRVCVNG